MKFEEAYYWFTVFLNRCSTCFSDDLDGGSEKFYKPKRFIKTLDEKEQWCGIGRRELT
jgi:hypothetical protein